MKGIVQKGISNLLDNENNQPSTTKNFLEETDTKLSQQTFDGVLTKNLFDKEKTKTQNEIDDFLYEIPDNMPDLTPGDAILNNLGTEVEDLINPSAPISKKEEEDEVLKK